MTISDTQTPVTRVVAAAKKPLPKWMGLMGMCLVAAGAAGHDKVVLMLGGGAFGERVAAAVVVIGGIISTLAHSLGGTGGEEDVRD